MNKKELQKYVLGIEKYGWNETLLMIFLI